MPAEGTCDNNSLLQGRGKAYFHNMFIVGEFKDGRPIGEHRAHFLSTKAKNVLDRGIKLNAGNSWDSARGMSCSMHYENGKIASKEILCNEDGKVYKITPFDGKVRLELTRDGWAFISADLPQLEITNGIETIIGSGEGTLIGTAESVKIGIFSQVGSPEVLAENVAATVNYLKFGSAGERVSIKGNFQLRTQGKTILSTYNLDIKSLGKQIDKKYLFVYQVNDIKYEFVPFRPFWGSSDGDVYYFKSSNGLEFDGSPSICALTGEWGKVAIGAKLIETTKSYGEKAPRWDIVPICGKVTTAEGKSFTGKFDREGRPIAN